METKGWLLGALLAPMLVLGPPAAAQIPIPEDSDLNYSLNVGAVFFASQNVESDVSPTIGISWYGPAGDRFGNNATFGLSADWLQVKRINGGHVQVVPLLFNYRQYGVISSYRVFVTLGIGLIATTDSIPEMQLSDGANFGWSGGLGFDVSNQLYVQARFIASSNPGDDGFTSVQIGYRF